MLRCHRDEWRVTGAGCGIDVLVASPESTVRIDVGVLTIGNSDHVNPLSRGQLVLEIAAGAFPAREVEDIKADAVSPIFSIAAAIYSEEPLFLAMETFAKEVDVAGVFCFWK
jgi:hypothetical protein